MNEYEIARLAVARDGLDIAAGNMLAAIIAAVGIWVFGIGMLVQNWLRAKAEQLRAKTEQLRAEAEQLRAEAEQLRAEAEQRRAEAEQRRAEAEQHRHEETMTALTELIRRTSPSRPRPAE